MMKPHCSLTKSLTYKFRSCAMDPKAGTTANTIEGVYTVSDNGKTQERQQLSIEGARLEISSRDEGMGNTVDFHQYASRDNTIVILCRLMLASTTENKPLRGDRPSARRSNRKYLWLLGMRSLNE